MKVLSLFDGISCGMVALERIGVPIEKYVAYEIEEDAIKISKHNYPQIEHKGDVFAAEYKEGEFDLLIGGSPCTYWSIAKTDGKRETTSSGIGFDLFMQYVRALREAKPKYFLYENNFSISQDKKTYCNLTVNDYEALQTLPIGYVDNVKIKSTSKYRAIGNGWTVDVIAHILKGVV